MWLPVSVMGAQGLELFSVCIWSLNDCYAYDYAGLPFIKHIVVYQKEQGLCAEVQQRLYLRKSYEKTLKGQQQE